MIIVASQRDYKVITLNDLTVMTLYNDTRRKPDLKTAAGGLTIWDNNILFFPPVMDHEDEIRLRQSNEIISRKTPEISPTNTIPVKVTLLRINHIKTLKHQRLETPHFYQIFNSKTSTLMFTRN